MAILLPPATRLDPADIPIPVFCDADTTEESAQFPNAVLPSPTVF